MKGITKMQKGITLIALIITIVVLLILAAVAISSITNDGILNYAQNAAKDYNQAVLNEKYYLSELEEILKENQTGVRVEKVTDVNPGVLEGSGTEAAPYVINSIEDLVFFAYDVTNGNNYSEKIINLGLSLDFNSTKSYVEAFRTDYGKYGYNGELKTLLTSGEGFKGIGIFSGIFDGKENYINGLYMSTSLFAKNAGTIKSLNVAGSISNSDQVGGICKQNTGIILECNSYVKISCKSNSGGIAGTNAGTISKSCNYGNIIGSTVTIGGIVGYNTQSGTVNYCFNDGSIKNTRGTDAGNTGGIVGANVGTISYSYNSGNIEAKNVSNVGGIAGINYSAIEYCYNSGNLDAMYYIGGISGFNTTEGYNTEAVIIKNCYNIGNIDNVNAVAVGGILAASWSKAGEVTNCFSKCNISVSNDYRVGRDCWRTRR